MQKYVIALDVGGTSVKSGIVDDSFSVPDGFREEHPALSGQNRQDILENFLWIIETHLQKLKGLESRIDGIGLAFPGPFDYEKGICYNTGIGKFESIYGVNVGQWLKRELAGRSRFAAVQKVPLIFMNDAAAFALGEFHAGKGKGSGRGAYITLGTGCGSTFLERDRIVKGEYGIPEEGYIFHMPYKDSVVDDYLSKRGFLNIAREHGFDTEKFDVRDIALLARDGNSRAKASYHAFGRMMGEILKLYVLPFKPEVLVIGGGISRGYDLFAEGILQEPGMEDLRIEVSSRLDISAMIGIAGCFFKGTE